MSGYAHAPRLILRVQFHRLLVRSPIHEVLQRFKYLFPVRYTRSEETCTNVIYFFVPIHRTVTTRWCMYINFARIYMCKGLTDKLARTNITAHASPAHQLLCPFIRSSDFLFGSAHPLEGQLDHCSPDHALVQVVNFNCFRIILGISGLQVTKPQNELGRSGP